MGNKFLLALVMASVFWLPYSVFATSGACSWHGGVNCSAGPGSSGGAICYDGWESSVPYSLMQECVNHSPTVSYCLNPYSIPGLTQTSCAFEQKMYDDSVLECQGMNARSGGSGCQVDDSQLRACQASLDSFNQAVVQYQQCINDESAKRTAENQFQLQLKQSQFNLAQCGDANATYDQSLGKCSCPNGRHYSDLYRMCVVISPIESCHAQLGQNATLSGGVCSCQLGYAPNTDTRQCTAIDAFCKSIDPNATANSDANLSNFVESKTALLRFCMCQTGYAWNQNYDGCVAVNATTSNPSSNSSTVYNDTIMPSSANVSPSNTSSVGKVEAATITITAPVITANIGKGSKGADVITLQQFLENKGFLTLPLGTHEGYFGKATKQALIAFQKSTGLPATGYCGAMTRSIINNQ